MITLATAETMPSSDFSSSLEHLVCEVVEGAVSWPPGSFAILASASQPDWYVQVAGDPQSQYVVEVSDPAYTDARPFGPEHLRTVTDLGFRPTDVNFQMFVGLDTEDEVDELCDTLVTVLGQVFGLSTSRDISLTLEVANAGP